MERESVFDKQKKQTLKSLSDLSRKGSFDHSINEFLTKLNNHLDYFTLSSCSGRILVIKAQKEGPNKNKKKGCHWLICSHETVDADTVWKILNNEESVPSEVTDDMSGIRTLKFEPFILHVQCRNLEAAKKLHTLSLESGYRNSGLTLGKAGKIVLAVRSTHGLEAPLTDMLGNLIVDKRYIKFVVELANSKLAENEARIRLYEGKCNDKLFDE